MVEEANKAAYCRLYQQYLNGNDESVLEEIVAPEVVSHSAMPGQPGGIEGFRGSIGMLREAFPDLHCEMRDVIAEGDKVVGYFHVTGTHRGSFMGHPPTGAPVAYDEMVIVRFEGGRIIEHWSVADVLGLMLAVGAMTPAHASGTT